MTSVVYIDKLYNLKYPITCQEVIQELGMQGQPNVILGLKVNGVVQSLNSVIRTTKCTVSPVYQRSNEGKSMARKSELLLLRYALHKLYPDVSMEVVNEFGDCTECELVSKITEEQLNSLREMFKNVHSLEIKEEYLPFDILNLHFVESHQRHSKSLIESLHEPVFNCAVVDNFAVLSLDQPYLSLPSLLPEISSIECAENNENNVHILLKYPQNIHTDTYIYEQRPKITVPMNVNKELDVGKVNKAVSDQKTDELMTDCESHHLRQMTALLKMIKEKNCKLILIAGPSSSGKTTFAHKVALGLKGEGLKPLVLSVDNYYVHHKYCPLTPEGKRDWEQIDALRLSLLNDHLIALMEGKEVIVPHFDFATSTPIPEKGKPHQLEENGVIIMEGIHCLNERLTEKIPADKKVKIFIAPVSHQLNLTDDVILDNNMLRIQRRMVRDKTFRGYTPARTLACWDDVSGAEKIWIYPYIKDADFVFSSFLTTEVNTLSMFSRNAMRLLSNEEKCYGFAQAYQRLLSYYLPLDSHDYVGDSIIREFIGNGIFDCH